MARESFFLLTRLIFALAPVMISSCSNQNGNRDFSKEIDSLINKWVPDKREGIFEAKLSEKERSLILRGETNLAEAKEDLIRFLASKKIVFTDSLRVLPDTTAVKLPWGLIKVSVCNMRSEPAHDAEMLSQALMGTPVRIIKKNDEWYLIQTPDNYLGWTDSEAVELLGRTDFENWKRSPRVIFTDKFGDIFQDRDNKVIISDVTAGCILKIIREEGRYYKVEIPDGREGFINSWQCIPFDKWADSSHPDAGNIIPYSKKYMGTPYLWGGTSAKGLDCSGFVKTVYFMNGLILARDVSLQIRHGRTIASFNEPDSLKPGDLLFFGTAGNNKVRATHVGIYIGDTEFIHESGMVRINSLDSSRSNYSAYRRKSFVGARRILGEYPATGLQPVSKHPWYK